MHHSLFSAKTNIAWQWMSSWWSRKIKLKTAWWIQLPASPDERCSPWDVPNGPSSSCNYLDSNACTLSNDMKPQISTYEVLLQVNGSCFNISKFKDLFDLRQNMKLHEIATTSSLPFGIRGPGKIFRRKSCARLTFQDQFLERQYTAVWRKNSKNWSNKLKLPQFILLLNLVYWFKANIGLMYIGLWLKVVS